VAQLSRISGDATLSSRPQGLTLLNAVPAGRIAPAAPALPALVEQSMKELNEIRQALQAETESFRHVILSTGNGLREAVAMGAQQEVSMCESK
jgi:hypothetical protein